MRHIFIGGNQILATHEGAHGYFVLSGPLCFAGIRPRILISCFVDVVSKCMCQLFINAISQVASNQAHAFCFLRYLLTM